MRGDVVFDIAFQLQEMKKLSQCPDPCLFDMNGRRLVISDEGRKVSICDGSDSRTILYFWPFQGIVE